jgi:hypothetical protein
MSAPAPIPVTLTDADIAAARQWWQTHARRADRALLDAGIPDERRAERALDAAIAHSNRTTVAALAEQLRTRAITPDAWEAAMTAEVTAARICGVACALGWSLATPATVGRYV